MGPGAFVTLPDGISNWQQLRDLQLYRCGLEKLPESISMLQKLDTLLMEGFRCKTTSSVLLRSLCFTTGKAMWGVAETYACFLGHTLHPEWHAVNKAKHQDKRFMRPKCFDPVALMPATATALHGCSVTQGFSSMCCSTPGLGSVELPASMSKLTSMRRLILSGWCYSSLPAVVGLLGFIVELDFR